MFSINGSWERRTCVYFFLKCWIYKERLHVVCAVLFLLLIDVMIVGGLYGETMTLLVIFLLISCLIYNRIIQSANHFFTAQNSMTDGTLRYAACFEIERAIVHTVHYTHVLHYKDIIYYGKRKDIYGILWKDGEQIFFLPIKQTWFVSGNAEEWEVFILEQDLIRRGKIKYPASDKNR